MAGFQNFGVVFEQRATDPALPSAGKVILYQLNDGSTNVLYPNGSKIRLDNTLVEAQLASLSGQVVSLSGMVYADIATINGRLTDLELVNGLQSGNIASLSAAVAGLGGNLDNYVLRTEAASVSAGFNSRIGDLEIVNGLQSSQIAALSAKDASDVTYTVIASLTGSLDVRIDDLELVNGLQSSGIQALSAAVAGLGGDLSNYVLRTEASSVSAGFNARISDTELVNGLQSANIQSLSASIAGLGGDYVLRTEAASVSAGFNGRIGDLEVVNGLQSSGIAAISGSLTNYALLTQLVAVSAALDSKKFDKTGGQISGDVIISGNLSVSGGYFVTYTEHVSAKDNLITINAGEQGAGVTAGVAGIEVDRGTLPKYEFMFVESSDTFRIGEEGSTQAVATREDTPNPNVIPFWNASAARFDTTQTWLTPAYVQGLSGQSDITRSEVAAISAGLQSQISTLGLSASNHEARLVVLENSIYKGFVPSVINQDVYTVSHGTINISTDYPLISMITPAVSSTIFVQAVTNRTVSAFDVVLSGLPDTSGYGIYWQINK
jgi:uncharacterized coiled-coil protein SlyX